MADPAAVGRCDRADCNDRGRLAAGNRNSHGENGSRFDSVDGNLQRLVDGVVSEVEGPQRQRQLPMEFNVGADPDCRSAFIDRLVVRDGRT